MIYHTTILFSCLALALTSLLGVKTVYADPVVREHLVGAPRVNVSRMVVKSPLYEPSKRLAIGQRSKGSKELSWENQQGEFRIRGTLPKSGSSIVLLPPGKQWDMSGYSYLRIDFTNRGSGLVWVKGRLDNVGAKDYANSTASSAFALPGERVTLGFPYPRQPGQNDASRIFDTHSGKPNGHRTHWKRFDPEKVISCRLNVQSSAKEILLEDIQIHLTHQYGVGANKQRMQMPYLDRFGQVRLDVWPGKINDQSELLKRNQKELAVRDGGPKSFNRYGGWKNGPKLKSTGYFYTAKHNGKWWLVDPSGALFFSQGINTVGYSASTPMGGQERRKLFEWLPAKDDPIRKHMVLVKKNNTRAASFIRANAQRTFGDNWQQPAFDRIHKRMRFWGMNTLGAWSDPLLFVGSKGETRTPYTEMLHLWRKHETRLTEGTPDPFSDDFPAIVRSGLEQIVKERGHDPWCLGVFIDNETKWPNNLVQLVFGKPATQPAKLEFITYLKKQYGSIAKLNAAWGTSFDSWKAMQAPSDIVQTASRKKDFDRLYSLLADRYYQTCRDEMRRVMPNHLYLGSRIHTCPELVKRSCAKYVDVYSSNKYDALPGRAGLPADVDKPVLISEYHFAAPDRGVPGVGLSPVGDQHQRSRSFAAYSVGGLLHPQVVGVHWFAYADQSAAGRPYENYQIGFVDVTDTPYPIITTMSRKLADRMYQSRNEKSSDLLGVLKSLYQN